LEARLSKEQKELIQRAADLSNRSLTDFVLSASQEAANRIIQEQSLIKLSANESKKFVDLLLNPTAAKPALKKAAKRYDDFLKKNH